MSSLSNLCQVTPLYIRITGYAPNQGMCKFPRDFANYPKIVQKTLQIH